VNKLALATSEAEEEKGRVKVPRIKTRDRFYPPDRILVIGGIGLLDDTTDATSRLVEEYFPLKSEWTTKSSLPDSRHHSSACLLNGFVYLIGEYWRFMKF
jgi:hypothetical protein